jgi:CAAX protease family protein
MEPEKPVEEKTREDELQQQPAFSRYSLKWAPGMQRLQGLWKTILFLAFGAEVGPALILPIARRIFGAQVGTPGPEFLLFVEAGSFGIVLMLTLFLAWAEKRPFGEYGLPVSDAFRANFWVGLLLGLAEASVLIGAILVLGAYSFGRLELQGSAVLRWGALHLLLFLFVGLYEEFLFRGYVQFTLSKVMGFWPAAILLSVGFGLIHLGNRGEDWVGAMSVAAVGLLFAFTLKRSGNLWYAVGLHAGFDWAESFLYSVPDSGEMLRGHLSNALRRGPDWLTGGSVGPEGSVFCFVTIGLQFLVAMWLFPAKEVDAESSPIPQGLKPDPDQSTYVGPNGPTP